MGCFFFFLLKINKCLVFPLCRQKKLEVAMDEEGLADEEVILLE